MRGCHFWLYVPLWSLMARQAWTTPIAPTLPFNEINILILTDVHSWVGGHSPNEPLLNADYGDVLSFYERLYEYCETSSGDLYFVMNGDWIDGTGLSMNGDAYSLTQILEKMPWNAVNIGNHELYHADVVEFMQEPGGIVDWFGDAYLSSNIIRTKTKEPIGNRYTVMRGKETAVLTFGFLYNMKDNVDIVTVEEVEDVVQEAWFVNALRDEVYDGIVVLAHMHFEDPLVTVILNKIREEVEDTMPIQFVTGHSHMRRYAVMDDWSTSLESGRYLDTVGFASFPTHGTIKKRRENNETPGVTSLVGDSFQYRYIDANKDVLKDSLGVEVLTTRNGAALSEFIDTVQEKMGLTEQIGCADKTYYLENATYHPQSLWGYFVRHVVPTEFPSDQVLLLSKGLLRYHLLEGRVQVGHILEVAPFNDTLYVWKDIPASVIQNLNTTLNLNNETWLPDLPKYVFASAEPFTATNRTYDFITDDFDEGTIQKALIEIYPQAADIQPERYPDTSTAIWLKYIRDHSPCGEDVPSLPPKKNTGGNNDGRSPNDVDHTTGGPQSSISGGGEGVLTDDAELGFAAMAILAILVLGSINVWQRGKRYQQHVVASHRATMEALNEYEESDEYDGEEIEGRFV